MLGRASSHNCSHAPTEHKALSIKGFLAGMVTINLRELFYTHRKLLDIFEQFNN